MAWTALIVDDEGLARSNLQLALAEHPQWACIGACASAAQARAVLAAQPVDLVLLDIRMPRENGLVFAAELARQPRPPLIAFVTAYDEHAIAAFEVFAVDYLLKPFDDARLAAMLSRAAQMLRLKQSAALADSVQNLARDQAARAQGDAFPALTEIVVRSIGHLERVAVTDVRWLDAAGNYVSLHLDGRTVLHRSTLSALAGRLPAADFIRVHRTALVRPDLIVRLRVTGDGTYAVDLRCGDTVPVSERYVAAVRALFDHRRPA